MTIAAFYYLIIPLYIGSLSTLSSEMTKLIALVVGTPKPYISYDARNYLTAELTTLFPSACLENAFTPLPFN